MWVGSGSKSPMSLCIYNAPMSSICMHAGILSPLWESHPIPNNVSAHMQDALSVCLLVGWPFPVLVWSMSCSNNTVSQESWVSQYSVIEQATASLPFDFGHMFVHTFSLISIYFWSYFPSECLPQFTFCSITFPAC